MSASPQVSARKYGAPARPQLELALCKHKSSPNLLPAPPSLERSKKERDEDTILDDDGDGVTGRSAKHSSTEISGPKVMRARALLAFRLNSA